MKIKILTLFPEMIRPALETSILGRAIRNGLISVDVIDIRNYAENRHKNADDYPFGGGAGMVMLPQPVVDAIEQNAKPDMRRVYMSPRGRTLTQKVVEEYAKLDSLLLLCGHYEGVDQRALDMCIDEELSIGDYVVTGGELGALVTVDAVARLVPGVLGCDESGEDESFTTGLLEYPQYTRPADFRGQKVPDVLLGGNHKDILAWRRSEALKLTRMRRPEMLETAPLNEVDHETLRKFDVADRMIAELAERGVRAERMDMFEEAAYAKAWFARFVPAESRAAAKKLCFSGRRHIGYLYQAFEAGYAPAMRDEGALSDVSGAAVLYLNRDGVALTIDRAEAVGILPRFALLTAQDMAWTIAVSNRGEMYRSM